MRKQDLLAIGSTALITAAITIVAFWGHSTAAGDGDGLTPAIEQPQLSFNGATVTVTASDGKSFKAGDEPVLNLRAVNTTDQPLSVSTEILMTSTTLPINRMSRMIPANRPFWNQSITLELAPRETKVAPVATVALPANASIDVVLRAIEGSQSGNAIKAMKFSTVESQ